MSTPYDPNTPQQPQGGFGYGSPQQPGQPNGAQPGAAAPNTTPYGAPQQAYAGAPAQPSKPAAPRHPGYPNATPGMSGLARGIVIGGIVLGAVIVGAVGLNIVGSTFFSPQSVAREYMNAIASGDLAKATKMAEPESTSRDDATLLESKEVLAKAENRISDVQVGSVGSTGYTRVTFSVDGHKQSISLQLARAGKQAVFFDKWVVDKSIAYPISVSASGADSVSVNGVDVAVSRKAGGYLSILAYPGVYDIGTPDSNKWLEADNAKVVVGAYGSDGAASIDIQPTAALQKEVEKQINANIDKCAASTEARPSGCPFYTYAYGDVQGLSWKVDSYPTIKIQNGSTLRFTGDGGKATATYQQRYSSSSPYTPRTSTDTFYLFGTIKVSGDKVTVSYE
ncbi:hypothetical protein [Schumannella soli]|uniref:DUF4878 domain-containing protein n=1 Tax=Schumannella soli TaxID=2590779 RepID=A0A506Y162_9MICO|nr:hypothetical protein [Schumannella soli]TPW76286.1 hypothetical protein FJ657_10895 [Schumannella soli]